MVNVRLCKKVRLVFASPKHFLTLLVATPRLQSVLHSSARHSDSEKFKHSYMYKNL